jgi:hypothetical protein
LKVITSAFSWRRRTRQLSQSAIVPCLAAIGTHSAARTCASLAFRHKNQNSEEKNNNNPRCLKISNSENVPMNY